MGKTKLVEIFKIFSTLIGIILIISSVWFFNINTGWKCLITGNLLILWAATVQMDKEKNKNDRK